MRLLHLLEVDSLVLVRQRQAQIPQKFYRKKIVCHLLHLGVLIVLSEIAHHFFYQLVQARAPADLVYDFPHLHQLLVPVQLILDALNGII